MALARAINMGLVMGMAATHVGQRWAMGKWAMVLATTLMDRWAMVRATTLTLMNMAITTCTNLGPMGWSWDRARLWAMLWALERNMRDMVAMEWALRVAPLTRNNTVAEGAWVVTAAAATVATAAMTSATAKITTGFHV
ncbi:hypothetical protein HAX54_040920 [Datura stramonium]|uniref:Secreted protein n=1 Tax=Datura stramonium TaxID=4076 RepID=A0ABS8SKX5_DATST|nr:hypothetical protein [Datura stramonium]